MANFQVNKAALDALAKQGATFVPITWPAEPSTNAMTCILNVEAGGVCGDHGRDNTVDQVLIQNARPNTFRAATRIKRSTTSRRTALAHC